MGSKEDFSMSSRPSGFAPKVVTSFTGEQFQLTACIGRGATGGVYRARTAESSFGFTRDICIKRLSGQLSSESERAMREEARLLASVRHANVVSLLAMGHEPSGAPFLVLELIDGADLRVLEKAVARQSDPDQPGPAGALPDSVAIHIACALLRALAAVQRAIPGLVHRDVTPHNVLISREGEVKLSDFGIALALDVRTDLFAVGVVLFELLARKRPWFVPGGTLDEILAIERGEIASILECRPRLDRQLASVIDRLLALDMRDRFPDADAALRALGPFSAGDLGSLRLAAIVDRLLPRPEVPKSSRSALAMTESAPRLDSLPSEVAPEASRPMEVRCDLVAYRPPPIHADLAVNEATSPATAASKRAPDRE
jgi:serine/threonine protein kinase